MSSKEWADLVVSFIVLFFVVAAIKYVIQGQPLNALYCMLCCVCIGIPKIKLEMDIATKDCDDD